MKHVDALREQIPDHARDLRLNLSAVLSESSLTAAQRWGVAVASAGAARRRDLLDAIVNDARAEVGDAVVDDGLAASALMAMNNVFYRFRHLVGKEEYGKLPARLRMNRLAKPATTRVDLELFSLAASAIHGCEVCVKAHERTVLDGGLTEQNVHDAVRIAAVVHGVAVTLDAR
jgi:alkyl hydroperoxide reductase subunit D